MFKNNILRPLGIHLIVNIVALIILNLFNTFDQLMLNATTRTIIYLTHTIIMISLYIFFSQRYLTQLPKTNLIKGTGIILLINLTLVMFYYGMIGIETGLMIESAGLPIIILSTFNSSFFPTIQLINVPEILTLVILMSASPLTIVFSTLIV